jgi:glycosyl hydrolase family 20
MNRCDSINPKLFSKGHGLYFPWALCLLVLILTFSLMNKGYSAIMTPLLVLPQPKNVQQNEGVYQLNADTRIFLSAEGDRPELLAALELAERCGEATGAEIPVDRPGLQPIETKNTIVLDVKKTPDTDPLTSQGYTLEITSDRIELLGNSLVGLFHGIQTLNQMVENYGSDLPCVSIQDSPDFIHRGFYHDVCRGKVPKLDTIKWLIDYLAAQKINMFQLYIEHPFAFRFDPEIAHGDALTPDEILELGAYCADRRIDFVPSLQSFGHMAGVFTLDKYRHLADVEMEGSWEDLDWHQRMVGATIDISNPKALALLEKMHDCYLPLFDSKFVNVCADETYDLGKGKTKELADKEGKATLYLRHINWLNELSKKYDKRMMFWGDVINEHPERIPDIPKDAIALNWGYWRDTDYAATKLYADAGLDFMVCPGTSGWNRLLNFFGNADDNIRSFATAGKEYGAIGLLNTDWGDHGHFNLLAGSLHGISLGAAMSWNEGNPDEKTFDKLWNLYVFGDEDGECIEALKNQDEDQEGYLVTWTYFYRPFTDGDLVQKTTDEEAAQLRKGGTAAVKVFEEYLESAEGDRWILEELLCASKMNILYAEKYEIAKQLQETESQIDSEKIVLAKRLRTFADDVEAIEKEYTALWLARNKRTDLDRIIDFFGALVVEAREIADGL